MGYPDSPVSIIVRVYKTMCGYHTPPWSQSIFRYGLLGIPVEVIQLIRSKQALIDCRMLRITANLSLWVRL